jgi:hypothetical protein
LLVVERKREFKYLLKMRRTSQISILLTFFLFGCAHDESKRGHGEVGEFILQQTLALVPNTKIVATNNLPKISENWRYSKDQYGVVIRMSKECYPMVEIFLRQAFGTPKLEPTDTNDGGKLGVYRLTSKGGAIQFVRDENFTQIIILRPLTQKEIQNGFIRALGSKEFLKVLAAPPATNQ